MRRAVPAFLLLLAATAPAMPNGARLEQRQRAQAEATDEIVIYRTKEGDTLKGIASQWFVNPEDWRLAMSLNKIAQPEKLAAGTALQFRSSWLKTNPITAELVAFRGDVRVVRGAEALPVAKGMALSEGDMLVTGANGFATLALPDKSQVSLPSASRIRLARLRQVPMSDSIDRRFTLEQGRSEARVTPMANPASRFLITTPVAVAAVRGTQFKVSYTPDEFKAATAVTEGKVSVSRVGGIEDVLVRGGFGNVTTSTGATRAFALLPAPAVDTPERVQDAELVTFRIKAVPGAVRYLVEIATDAQFVDRVGSVETDGTDATFPEVPNGQYYVRAFAIDAFGLEGMPGKTVQFERNWAGQTIAEEKRAAEERKAEIARLGEQDGSEFSWFDSASGSQTFASVSGGTGSEGGSLFGVDGAMLGNEPIIPFEATGLIDPTAGSAFAGLLAAGSAGSSGSSGGSGGSAGGGGAGGGGSSGGGGFGGSSGGGSGSGGGGGSGSGGGAGSGGSNGGPANGGDSGSSGGANDSGGSNGSGSAGGGSNGGGSTSGGSNGGENQGSDGNGGNGGTNPNGGGQSSGGSNGDGSNGGGSSGGDDGGNGGGGVNPISTDPDNPGAGGDEGNGDGPTIIPTDPSPPAQGPGQPNDPPAPGQIPGGDAGGEGAGAGAIPEPGTWMMLIAGFGLVGVAMRRQRRKQSA